MVWPGVEPPACYHLVVLYKDVVASKTFEYGGCKPHGKNDIFVTGLGRYVVSETLHADNFSQKELVLLRLSESVDQEAVDATAPPVEYTGKFWPHVHECRFIHIRVVGKL
jgi:hypothetical protein